MPADIWVIRTTKCADGIEEKTKFMVPGEIGDWRSRESRRSVNRAAKNTASAGRNVARILNNNFVPGDRFLTLTLSEAGWEKLQERAEKILEGYRASEILGDVPELTEDDALLLSMEQEMENQNTRAQKACKSQGVEIRYLAVASDREQKKGDWMKARPHIHAVVNKEAAEIYKQKWSRFGTIIRDEVLSAWKSGGITDWSALANYIISQTRIVNKEKRYAASRNLEKPAQYDRMAKKPAALLRVPKGAILLEQSEYRPGWPQYIRYIRRLPEDEEETTGEVLT